MDEQLRRRLVAAAERGLNARREDRFVLEVARALYGDDAVGLGFAPSHRTHQQTDRSATWEVHPMKTRAKFYVSGVTLVPGSQAVDVALQAVGRGDRNASWAAATPSGSMNMHVNNPAAAAAWEEFMQEARRLGKQPEVFVDIYPATDGWAGDGHKFRPGEGAEGTAYDARYCGECGSTQDQELRRYNAGTSESEVIGLAHPNG